MFKRDIVIAIRAAGTNDTPVVLPVVDESIDVSTQDVSTTVPRNFLGTPQFTNLVVNRGKKETLIKFTTYIKPYLDTNMTLAEKLLHESLLGSISETGTQMCTTSTDTYTIKKFDIFLIFKSSGTTYLLADAISISGEYVFDIKGISRIKWQVGGISYLKTDLVSYNYPLQGLYLRNKFTTAKITFPQLSTDYDLASTNFSISIKNSVTFQYTEKITESYNVPNNNPIITNRDITTKFSLYFKVLTLSMYEDLINTIENTTNLANFTASIGDCINSNIDITLNNIQIKLPKIRYEEVATLDLYFKGTTALICYKE